MSVVIDASAVLAILLDERGADVAAAASRGALLSAVNAIEVFQRFAREPKGVEAIEGELRMLEIAIVPFDAVQARIAADLKSRVGKKDSLADRACLALSIHTGRPCVTAEHRWAELDVGVDVRLIREWRDREAAPRT